MKKEVHIAPLVVFRIAFGILMFVSILRFMLKGWVNSMYVVPKLFFPYYGLEWIKVLPETGMYLVFVLLLMSSLGILFGIFYRFSSILFFFLFTYVELLDKTNYLNHYYFISLVSFLLIFLPVDKNFSLDNIRLKRSEQVLVPGFFLLLLQLQMFAVYFFAGLAKVNEDWLLDAQPLRIWLPAFSHYPLIGEYLEKEWVAYLFSWFGCIYDLLIGFFLFNRRTVNVAYFFVLLFHSATAIFFNIGMFPYIMMTITIVFFREEFHLVILNRLKSWLKYDVHETVAIPMPQKISGFLILCFVVYFAVQLFLPFRYLFYKGNLFWTEQGYRFSWRVMLMEKAGTCFFFVRDKRTGRETEVNNKEFLTYMQEKMMSTQPDMMIDYARFLKKEYEQRGFHEPAVHVKSYVTLNGRGTREFADPNVDLAGESNSFLRNKNWIRTFEL